MSTTITSLGVEHASIVSEAGWIEIEATGPDCLFCGEPASGFKPNDRTGGKTWLCRPCETTWTA